MQSVLQVFRNSIAWRAICLPYLSGLILQSDRLKQVNTIEKARWDLVRVTVTAYNRGDRLMKVRITVVKRTNFRDFHN